MADRVTKGCLGCGCVTFILSLLGIIYGIVMAGEAPGSGGGAIGGGIKLFLIACVVLVVAALVFFLMRLDLIMARFKN